MFHLTIETKERIIIFKTVKKNENEKMKTMF